MKNRVLVIFLSLMLVISLIGCSAATPSKREQESSKIEVTKSVEKQQETKDVEPASAEPIKIGLYAPLTGPHVISGEAMVQGAELAINQINKRGGLLGRQIRLISYDDKSTPENAVQCVTKLVEVDNVALILASIHSGNILATADIVEASKTPELGLGTSPSWLDGSRKFLFRVLPSNDLTSSAIVDLIGELGITKMSVLYRADEAGVTNNKSFSELCKDAGIEVVASEAYQPTDTDFTGQINKIMRSGMEGVMCFGTSGDPMVMLNQLYQLGFKGKIFGPEIFSSGEVKKVCGTAAENVIFAAPYCVPMQIEWANSDRERTYLNAFVEYFGSMPKSDVSYRTYDAMMIFEEVVKKIGTIDGDAVAEGIAALDGFEGLAGTFSYKTAADKGMYGEGILSCRTYVIEGGRDIEITPEKIKKIKADMAKK